MFSFLWQFVKFAYNPMWYYKLDFLMLACFLAARIRKKIKIQLRIKRVVNFFFHRRMHWSLFFGNYGRKIMGEKQERSVARGSCITLRVCDCVKWNLLGLIFLRNLFEALVGDHYGQPRFSVISVFSCCYYFFKYCSKVMFQGSEPAERIQTEWFNSELQLYCCSDFLSRTCLVKSFVFCV